MATETTPTAPPVGSTASTDTAPPSPPPPPDPDAPPTPGGGNQGVFRRGGDRMESVFQQLSTGAGSMVLVIIVAIAVFLIARAAEALGANTENFFTFKQWFPNDAEPKFGIAALAWGTLLSSAIALVMAFPVAIGVALFISHYAPRWLAQPLGYFIDLLAAVPSIVYGLWGFYYLNDPIVRVSEFLNKYVGWIPIFASEGIFGRSIFLASVVLAIMVLPIIAALSREVFLQTPTMNEEAALALGATRWEMVRMTVFPFGRPGVIGATMLGLGRALGETIAVAIVLSVNYEIVTQVLEPGGNTIAANIANAFGEANQTGRGALIASGLFLFAITLVVNMAARAIINRRREFTAGGA